MSNPTMALPIRLLSRSRPSQTDQIQRICRRCLATQTSETTPNATPHTGATTSYSAASTPYDPTLPFSLRNYPLTATDRALKRALPGKHHIRPQLLMHVDPSRLHSSDVSRQTGLTKPKEIVGVVVRTGRMDKTVTVRIPGQRWEGRIKKHFSAPATHLVHDPRSSLLPGDVVSLHRLRVSSAVQHVVASIVTPFGKPISERPPIPTPEERLAAYKTARVAKLHRRKLRREAAEGKEEATAELKAMGLDPGLGVKVGEAAKGGAETGNGKVLLSGVQLGGKAVASKISERARLNKERALRKQARAEGNQAAVETPASAEGVTS